MGGKHRAGCFDIVLMTVGIFVAALVWLVS